MDSTPRETKSRRQAIIVLVLATLAKLYLAATTLGTNDVVAFYQFAKAMQEHGLAWLYSQSILFNHPPLVGYALHVILAVDRAAFPFLLRLLGILADAAVVLALILTRRKELSVPGWGLLLLAGNPVSIMISGFHGNTDPMMTMLLFFAGLTMVWGRPALCGLFLALACQIKIVPLLFVPVFLLHWRTHNRSWPFAINFLAAWLIISAEALVRVPAAFVRHVLSYGGFWGTWGFTSLFRLSGLPQFAKVNYFGLTPIQIGIATGLKAFVVVCCLTLAWRRRNLGARAALETIALSFLVLFVFSPAVAPQYLSWLLPFLLLRSAREFAAATISSSLFLFAFYTATSGGFPWYFSNATAALNRFTTLIALLPWITFVGLLIYEVRRRSDAELLA